LLLTFPALDKRLAEWAGIDNLPVISHFCLPLSTFAYTRNKVRAFSRPVPWGIAIDRQGRIIVSLKDGSIICVQ
jgi:hypothetical protein